MTQIGALLSSAANGLRDDRLFRTFDDAGSHDNESRQYALSCVNRWISDMAL
jgi:hypothetical protein